MEVVTGEHADPEQIISWLRTPAGEEWSLSRIHDGLTYHDSRSGVFASVLRDGSAGSYASWPDPLDDRDDLDDPGWGVRE